MRISLTIAANAVLFILSAFFFPPSAFNQNTGDPTILSNNPICVLPALPFDGYLSIPYSKKLPQGGFEKSASFSVDYLTSGEVFGYTCTTWPAEAQTAFNYAVRIWGDIVESSQVINVNACWSTELGGSTLGSAGTSYWGSSGESIPQTLLEASTGINYDDPDIQAVFNAGRSDWYYGTDAVTPTGKIDFVTVVLHELGHGLGFADRVRIDDGAGDIECVGVAGEGCVGFDFTPFYPSTFSQDVETENGFNVTTITNPSEIMADLVTGVDVTTPTDYGQNLYLNAPGVVAAYGSRPRLYTPSTFAPGSSYSHFDLAIHPNELMKHALSAGQAIHDPNLASEYFYDMGWQEALLPVELISFSAILENSSTKLNWETASEINNYGYEIERSVDGKYWEKLGFVAGSGHSHITLQYNFNDPRPFSGINYYRLRQIDFDGKFTTSPIRSVQVHSDKDELVIYPVPATTYIKVKTGLESGEDLSYKIIDSRGTVMKTGTLQQEDQLDVSVFSSGIYRLVVNGNREIMTGSFSRK